MGLFNLLLQFPMRKLNETSRFMLLTTFLTKIFGFSMESWIVFLHSLYSPLIRPLETENIPPFGLDQDVNFCFCIYDYLFFLI